MSILEMLHKGNNDLSSLALSIGVKTGQVIDTQSISERFNERSVVFSKMLLEKCLSNRLLQIKTSHPKEADNRGLFIPKHRDF